MFDELSARQARDAMFDPENPKCACGCGRTIPDEEAPEEGAPGFVTDEDGHMYASWGCFYAVDAEWEAEIEAEEQHEADKYGDDFPMELEYEDPADDFPAEDGDDW